jgi:benzaldehyde dehydrogenase (NAD)
MNTVNRVNELIDDAVAKGARILCGGKASDTLMAATLIDGVTPRCASSAKRPLPR